MMTSFFAHHDTTNPIAQIIVRGAAVHDCLIASVAFRHWATLLAAHGDLSRVAGLSASTLIVRPSWREYAHHRRIPVVGIFLGKRRIVEEW